MLGDDSSGYDDNDDIDADDEYIEIQKDVLEDIQQDAEFERSFYIAVCGTDEFEVIPIPDKNGYVVSHEEKTYLEAAAKRQGLKILYRISHGKYATVFDPQTGKLGIMPETNSRGFAC